MDEPTAESETKTFDAFLALKQKLAGDQQPSNTTTITKKPTQQQSTTVKVTTKTI